MTPRILQVLSLSLILACFSAGAVESARSVVIRFAILDAMPFGGKDASGKPVGIYAKLLQALQEELPDKLSIEVVPYARAAHLVASRQADATLMFNASNLEHSTVSLLPVFTSDLVVQLRPGLTIPARAKLKSLTIGRMRGGCKELEGDQKFYELNTQEQGVQMLLAGRLDGFCTSAETLKFARASVDTAGRLDARSVLVIANKEVLLLVSKQLPTSTANRLRAAMQKLIANGTVARIVSSSGQH